MNRRISAILQDEGLLPEKVALRIRADEVELGDEIYTKGDWRSVIAVIPDFDGLRLRTEVNERAQRRPFQSLTVSILGWLSG